MLSDTRDWTHPCLGVRFCNLFNPPNQFLPSGIIQNDIRDSVLSMLVYVFHTEMTNDGYHLRGARSTSTVTLTPMRLHETCGLDVLLSKVLVFNYSK